MREINIDDTVWVDMSNCSFTPPHDSGYAVVIDIRVISGSDAVMYCVQFRGSDKVITVDERCITPIYEEKDTQEDTIHVNVRHYRDAIVEPILVMQEFFSHDELIGFLKGNILKYRLRAGHKGGEIEMKCDIDKIRIYEKWLDAVKNGERIKL